MHPRVALGFRFLCFPTPYNTLHIWIYARASYLKLATASVSVPAGSICEFIRMGLGLGLLRSQNMATTLLQSGKRNSLYHPKPKPQPSRIQFCSHACKQLICCCATLRIRRACHNFRSWQLMHVISFGSLHLARQSERWPKQHPTSPHTLHRPYFEAYLHGEK